MTEALKYNQETESNVIPICQKAKNIFKLHQDSYPKLLQLEGRRPKRTASIEGQKRILDSLIEETQ